MIVDKNSWHMWLNRTGNSHYEPTDLCSYFWHTVGVGGWWLLLISFGLFTATLVGILIFNMFINLWLILKVAALIVGSLLVCTVLFGVVSIILLVTDKLYAKYSRTGKKVKIEKVKKEKAPSFLWSWIKAKKGKYCPIIEVRE